MNSLKATLIGIFMLLVAGLYAQESSNGKNFVGAKVLFLDYQGLNDGESSFTNGLEVFYRRNLNDYLAVGVPLKAGFIDVVDDMNNRNFFSADAIVRGQYYQPSSKVVPYAFAGVGFVSESNGTSNTQIPIGAGIDFRIGQSSYLNIQGEYRMSNEDLRDNLQIGVGYVYKLGKAIEDRDGDGVEDSADACPDLAGKRKLNGCPDSDGDGISDLQDACPSIAGVETAKGCPDKDGDGVADKDDKCPEVAGDIDGCPDRDGDGIIDIEDRCPDEKGITADGCPEEVDTDSDGVPDSEVDCPESSGPINGCPDADGDGVADKDDDCPDVAGTDRGCPKESILIDSDKDGVPDEEDACPNDAGPVNGCPDTDGDGVADKDDACPNVKAMTADGCPEAEVVVDSDNDGVPDNQDQCPNEAGPINGCPDSDGDRVADKDDKCPDVEGLVSNQGCPEIKEEDKKVLDVAMRAVRFRSGSAILLEESYQILDQIVAILERYPEYHLQVAGYTDNVGNPDNNLILSEDRAKACYAHFIGKGIVPGRISYVGYGEKEPIGDNNRSAGRLLNRRVEFKLYLP
jgi:outer membrane protein OmpA-like peptidoglycan-associated protein